MFDDANIRSELYPFFHIALLNDFGSFALCKSDMLFYSAYSYTASPSLSVEVYPQCVVAVEVANYNMRHISASKWRDQELFSWWFVHGMYHYTG